MEEDTSPQTDPKLPAPEPTKKSNRYTRYILDPFQIFAIEKRNEILSRNPHMKNSELTNTLGFLWRRMSSEEKKVYQNLATKLHNNKCLIQRGKRGPNKRKLLKYKEITQTARMETSEPENDGTVLKIPNIYIMPRGTFGVEASKASIQLSESINGKIPVETS